jgi:NAD(P)-dependent dehydrogenase (short-subunit alcohol dehydrogenase family)
MTELHGRTALVTGSTSGVGVGIAHELAAAGAFVVVSGRSQERGAQVVDEIENHGGRAVFVGADLSAGEDAIAALADDAVAAAGGHVDVLVNNAALLIDPSPTEDLSPDLVTHALAVNVVAPMLLTGRLAPAMAHRGHGAVVNVGSINGIVGMGGSALYGVTKAAIHAMTRNWAAEYGPRGVRVNTVAPGPTATDLNLGRQELLAPILGRIPSGRMSTINEVGKAVAFLASDDAANIHGAMLTIDGGYTVG